MLLDRFVRLLLPRQTFFFDFLEGIAEKIDSAAKLFDQLRTAKGHAQFEEIAGHIKEQEKAADEFERHLHEALDRTFVTPIDREDLAALAKALDNVVDGMEHAATFAALYQLDVLTPAMAEMVRLTAEASSVLAGSAKLLRKFSNPEHTVGPSIKVHELESEADNVYRKAVAELFTVGLPPADLVRQKDMLFALEGAIDQCEDAMDVIRSVVVKNG